MSLYGGMSKQELMQEKEKAGAFFEYVTRSSLCGAA